MTDDGQARADAYMEGVNARVAGVPLEDNPYLRLAFVWQAGWQEEQEAAEEAELAAIVDNEHFHGCPQVGPVAPFECDYCQERARSMEGVG